MSEHNGQGDFRTTLTRSMAAHDHAPPLLRQILNYAVEPWSSEQLLDAWTAARGRGLSQVEVGKRAVRNIARHDLQRTVHFYGQSHPEARRHE